MTSVKKRKNFGENYHNQLYTLRSEIATYRWHKWLVTKAVCDAYFGESRNSLAVLAMKCDREYEQNRQPQPDTVIGQLTEAALLSQREGINQGDLLGVGGAA